MKRKMKAGVVVVSNQQGRVFQSLGFQVVAYISNSWRMAKKGDHWAFTFPEGTYGVTVQDADSLAGALLDL